MKNKVCGVIDFFKRHCVVVLYFFFFLLAIFPTIFPFFEKLGTPYKIGVLLLLTVGIIFIIIKKKIKLNYQPLIFTLIVFVVFSLYYFLMPRYFSFVAPSYSFVSGTYVTVVINKGLIISSIISIFNICFFVGLFLFVAPNLGLNKIDFSLFNVLFSLFLIAACVFSLEEIKNGSWDLSGLESFFQNKNTFGIFLMIGVFLTILTSSFFKRILVKILFYFLALIFMAFVILSKSSTSMIMSAIIVAVSVVYIIHDSKKLHLAVKISLYSLIVLLIVLVAASPVIPFLSSTFIGEYVKSIYNKISVIKDGDISRLFTSRGKFWMLGIHIISPEYLMLGHGIPVLEEIVYSSNVSYFSTSVLTNAYLTILDGLGIIGCVFYLGLFVLLLIVLFKDKSDLSSWLLILLLVFLIYGMFESLILFRSNTNSLIITPIIVVPSMIMLKNNFQIKGFRLKVKENEQK